MLVFNYIDSSTKYVISDDCENIAPVVGNNEIQQQSKVEIAEVSKLEQVSEAGKFQLHLQLMIQDNMLTANQNISTIAVPEETATI